MLKSKCKSDQLQQMLGLSYHSDFTNMATILPVCSHTHTYIKQIWLLHAVVDLEGVRVGRLNPLLRPNYFNFMGKFMKNQVEC